MRCARCSRNRRRRRPSPAFPTRRAISKASCARRSAPAKMQITPEAKRLLLARLGADRALSRAEIDKLVLYAHGKGMIEESDVEAAVGDAAELALDRIVMAAGVRPDGRGARRMRPQRRLGRERAGCHRRAAAPFPAAASHARRARCRPQPWMTSCAPLRPPPHFKQREAIEQQCRGWSLARLGRRWRASPRRRQGRAAQLARWRARWRRTCCWILGRWHGKSVGCVKRSA